MVYEEHHAIRAGAVTLEPLSRQVKVDGREIRVTRTEFELLHALIEHPGWVVSSSALASRVWKYDSPSSATITVHVANLRRKLRDAGCDGIIATVRGIGYRLRESATVRAPRAACE